MTNCCWYCESCIFCCECGWPMSLRLLTVLAPFCFACNGMYEGGNFSREKANRILIETNLDPPKGMENTISISDIEVEGVEKDTTISCRLTVSKAPIVGDLRPIVLHMHGGGYVFGSASQRPCKAFAADLANTGVHVLSCNYRLAPEYPFPNAVFDIFQVARWMASPAGKEALPQDTDYSKIIIAGDSAGGNLALVLGQLLRDGLNAELKPEKLELTVAHLLLVFPAMNLDPSHPFESSLRNTAMLPDQAVKFFVQAYRGDTTENLYEDRRYSPPQGGVEGLPPVTCVVGTRDRIYNDSKVLHQAVKDVNGDFRMIVMDNMPHAFMAIPYSKPYNSAMAKVFHSLSDIAPQLVANGSPEPVTEMKR